MYILHTSVVEAVSKHYTKEQVDMHLLQSLRFFLAHNVIDLKCKHIHSRVNNTTADHLSYDNLIILLFTLTGYLSTNSNSTATTPGMY